MNPISYFEEVWNRCGEVKSLHAYLADNMTSAMPLDELLRAEWVARVSALDLYVHELVAQNLLAIFEEGRSACPGYKNFTASGELLLLAKKASSPEEVAAVSEAFDLSARAQLGRNTFQRPNDIADGVRMISPCELWNEVALKRGATEQQKAKAAKALKDSLTMVVDRRNKIAHDGDLDYRVPRSPQRITRREVDDAANIIETIVRDIDEIVKAN